MTLVNDINLAALGEKWQGVARGVDDFVFLSVGTGLGSGLVLGGELHSGRNGAAGELDFALIGLGDGFDPSAAAVSAFAEELAQSRQVESVLTPPYEPREIFTAARQGDALAGEVVAEVARRIALHIAPVVGCCGRGARGARRWDRRQRRPPAGADPRHAQPVAAVPAAARGLEPG